jgi:two-component system, chemotaxis family, protein-glutamate methylesterase/glutaminase
VTGGTARLFDAIGRSILSRVQRTGPTSWRGESGGSVNHDLLLLGTSAGGVDALTSLCRRPPRDLPAAVLVVRHVAPAARSVMPSILSRAGILPAAHAQDGEPIRPRHIYVAPPDHHLVVSRDDARLLLRRGPQENRVRSSIDALFRSGAVALAPAWSRWC